MLSVGFPRHLCDTIMPRAETRRTQGLPVPRGGFHKAGEGPAFGDSFPDFSSGRNRAQRSVPTRPEGWNGKKRRAIYHNRTQKSRRSVSLRRQMSLYYLAYSMALVSRIRLTLIWPGYSSSSSIFLAISRARMTMRSSETSSGLIITRTSRPAWMA